MNDWQTQFEETWDACARQEPPDYATFRRLVENALDTPEGPAVFSRIAQEYHILCQWMQQMQRMAQASDSPPSSRSSQEDLIRFKKFKLLVSCISRLPPALKSRIEPNLNL
jgi:hypothetical protein